MRHLLDVNMLIAAIWEGHQDDLPALSGEAKCSSHVTDMYLAELAGRHGMKLATFDGGIHHPSVIGI